MSKVFTLTELAEFNGHDGKPSYLAFKGKVYDATEAFKEGEHGGLKAGTDITSHFGEGPHGEELFAKFAEVGTLA